MVRVRFAPSPTGNLHLGTLRTALFCWLYARRHGGSVILRIEDTDQQRSNTDYESSIFDGLRWLGLTMDESSEVGGAYGPYRQSERFRGGSYDSAIEQLLKEGHAYHCFCSEDELNMERDAANKANRPYVYSRKCFSLSDDVVADRLAAGDLHSIRFKMPKEICDFSDCIRGDISFDMQLISDFVIKKSDGLPSYNFACVVDDAAMEITHVIRGEDHISNTPRQIAVYQALGKPLPYFAHLPMILGSDRSKLSKRHGATNVIDYRDRGFLPDAMINFMTLLGWSPDDEQEIFSREELIDQFSLDRISKSGAIFDLEKLTWMNGQYIRQLDRDACFDHVRPFISSIHWEHLIQKYDEKHIKDCVFCVRDNLTVLLDINDHISLFSSTFLDVKPALDELKVTDALRIVWTQFLNVLTSCEDVLTRDSVSEAMSSIVVSTGFGKGKVWRPLRLAATGQPSGPDLSEVLRLLGRDVLIERFSYVLGNG